MGDNKQKIQGIKKLNLRNIVLPKQKALSSTTRNIRIKLSNPISNTLSNIILPINRNKPQNKLLAYTINSIQDRYQTITEFSLNKRTAVNTSMSNYRNHLKNKANNNIPSFTLYSQVNSSRNKNISNRLFNITNPTNSLNTLNTLVNERSSINNTTFSPSFNTSINSSFQKSSINQSKVHNKKIIMKPYATDKGHISILDRKKQLINEDVEKENQRDIFDKLKKIKFFNEFIKEKIFFLWLFYKRHREFITLRKQLALRLKNKLLIFDHQFKQSVNEIITSVDQIQYKNILYEIVPQNYERFFSEKIELMNKGVWKLNTVKNAYENREQLNKKVFTKLPHQKEIKTKMFKKRNSSKNTKNKQYKIITDYIISSALSYHFFNLIDQIDNTILNSSFIIDYMFIQNKLFQKPSQLQLMKPIETILQICSEAYREKILVYQHFPLQILLIKNLFEKNYLKIAQTRHEYLNCFHNLAQFSIDAIQKLKSNIKNEILMNSFKIAKDFLINSLSDLIRKESNEIIILIKNINNNLAASDSFRLSNIQIIKSKVLTLDKRIENSFLLNNEGRIHKKINQLKNKIDNYSNNIKTNYPIETIRKEIETIDQTQNYDKLPKLIQAVFVHNNILFEEVDTILSNLHFYFNIYSNCDSLSKIPRLFSEMTKRNNTSEEYLKKMQEQYNHLINSIDENCDYFYEQLNSILSLKENFIKIFRNKQNTIYQTQLEALNLHETKVNQFVLKCIIKVNRVNYRKLNDINQQYSIKEINNQLEEQHKNAMTVDIIDTINPNLSLELCYEKYIKQKLKYQNILQFSYKQLITVLAIKEQEDLLLTLSELSKEFNQNQLNIIHSSLANYQQSKLSLYLNNIKKIVKEIDQKKQINLCRLYPKFHLIENDELNRYDKSNINYVIIKTIFSKINPNKELLLSESNESILGIISIKEQLTFHKEIIIDLKQGKSQLTSLAQLFSLIDNEISNTLNKQIIDSLNTFNHKPFHQWCNFFLNQITICTLSLIFTNEISQILVNAQNNHNKNGNVNPKDEYKLIIEKYLKWLKLKEKIIEPLRGNIILTILNHLNIINSLIKTNTTNIDSFDWLKFLRHLWDQNKKEVIIECGGWSNYQLKTFVMCDRILLTPETDKIFLFNSSCFREKSASFIKITNNAIAYKEIFQEFASLFWADFLPINIINSNSLGKVKTIFDIGTTTRSWMFLENSEALDNTNGMNYLVYLSKFMQVIQQEVILNDIKFNNSERMFCLMGCIKINERIKFKENALKSSSRVMNFIKPDPKFYIKNILHHFGEKNFKKDINKIVSLIQKKEEEIKMVHEQFFFDYNFYNMLIRLIMISNTPVNESNMATFINAYCQERIINSFLLKNVSIENTNLNENTREKLKVFCENHHLLYNNEFLEASEFLINYYYENNNATPILVGYGKKTLIKTFFAFLNKSFLTIYQHSIKDYFSKHIYNATNNTCGNKNTQNNSFFTVIHLLFWQEELLSIYDTKIIITLKSYNEELLSELNTKGFKILRISKFKSKNLLQIYIEKIKKILHGMNVVITDEHSSALTEYIYAFLKSNNKGPESYSSILNEFFMWNTKIIEYHSNYNIHFNIKTLYNIVVQALLLTVPHLNNNEIINHLYLLAKKYIEELSNDFIAFYEQNKKAKYIYYDCTQKQFLSLNYSNYKQKILLLCKKEIIKEGIIIVTNDNSTQYSIKNCTIINDICLNKSVIEFYCNTSILREENSTAIGKINKKNIDDNEQYNHLGIYTVLSIDQWYNVSPIFDNTLKLYLMNNDIEKFYPIPLFISSKYNCVYIQIMKLFKVKLNQDEEQFIYSLIDINYSKKFNYSQINYDTIFTTIFKENSLFLSIVVSFNSEKEIKLFSLIKRYFVNYNVIIHNNTQKHKVKSNCSVYVGVNKLNEKQYHSNTLVLEFDQNNSLSVLNYFLYKKFIEVKYIREIANRAHINQNNVILNPEFILDMHKLQFSKMLYDILILDEISFNSQYSFCDSIKQLINYLFQSVTDNYLYTQYFLRFTYLSSYAQTKLLFKYLVHNQFKLSFLKIVSFSLVIESCNQSTKYSNELTMIISNTLTNYSNLISQPEIVNSQIFFINLIDSQSLKNQNLINSILEKIYLGVANHFLLALLLTFEIMVNNFEMSQSDLQYCIQFFKTNFIFHKNNSIKFKFDPFDTKEYIKSKGREFIEFYQSKTEKYSKEFVLLVAKSLSVYSKYFYTSNLNTIPNDVDKLFYYMIFIPEQSPSIFKYLINKYLRPLYCIEKFKVNSFLKKKCSVPMTIKADTCINITNFLCSLAAYYEINFFVIRNLDFESNSQNDLGYKYIVDFNITNLIFDAMAQGNWLFISTKVNLIQFLKIINIIHNYSSNNQVTHSTFKLFFDQNLIEPECNSSISNYTLLLQIDNNNIDDLEAAHDMWVNVLEENILTESIMDETQKDFLDVNSGMKNNLSAISDKEYSEQEIFKESDLTFLKII